MKLVLAGTPDFAREVFETIIADGAHEVLAIVSNPTRKGDRGKLVTPPAAELAIECGIPLLQFESVSKEGVVALSKLNADVMVTAAYGQILSDEILSLFPHGVINIHGSLLPKYRGAAPIQYALMSGDPVTGVTVMRTVREVDAGDVLLLREVKIAADETGGSLFKKLAKVGGDAALVALAEIERGEAVYTPQNHAKATFTKMLKKSDGKLDFSLTAAELERFVRALTPWPGAFTTLDGKIIKVFRLTCARYNNTIGGGVGEVVACSQQEGLAVRVKDGVVKILELQDAGGKRMSAAEYLRGHSVSVGAVLGSV